MENTQHSKPLLERLNDSVYTRFLGEIDYSKIRELGELLLLEMSRDRQFARLFYKSLHEETRKRLRVSDYKHLVKSFEVSC